MGNVRPLFDLGPLQECSAKSKHAHANTERPTPHETTGSCSNSIPVPPRHSSTWPRGASRAVRLQRLPTSTGYHRRSLHGMRDFPSSAAPRLGLPAALFLLLFAVTAYFGYYALSLLLELFSVPGRQPVLLLRALVGATSAAIVLGFIVRSASLWSPQLYLFLAFWLLYSLRIIADVQGSRVLLDREPRAYMLLAYGVCFLPAIAFALAAERVSLQALHRALTLTGAATICLTLLYFVTIQGPTVSRLSIGERINPISLGHLAGSALLLTHSWLLAGHHRSLPARIAYYTVLMLAGFFLLLAASRGPLISTVVPLGLSILFFLQRRYLLVLVTVCFLLGLTALLSIGVASALGVGLDRLAPRELVQALRWEERPTLWQEAIRAYATSPLFGSAFLLPNGMYPHNLVFEAFMATGTLGGILFLCFTVNSAWSSLRVLASGGPARPFALLALQSLVLAMFSGGLFNSPYFWYVGLALPTLSRIFAPTVSLPPNRSRSRHRSCAGKLQSIPG